MSNNEVPGNYVEEVPSIVSPIEGVSTGTVAFIGGAPQGPVLEPTLVTSWEQFEEKFGGLNYTANGFYLAHAVDMFFKNQGQRAYIVRATEDLKRANGTTGGAGRIEIPYRSGLPCLEGLEDINIVAMPDGTNILDQKALIEHCEKMRYRFAILDSAQDPREVGDAHDIRLQKEKLVSKGGYAAIYYPWLKVQDPKTKRIRIVPPSGAVAGVYVRSDLEKGVHKPPTGELVIGAIDIDGAVDQADQHDLYLIGVNVVRKFQGKGILVWGSRTTSSDSLWKNVNTRRLMIYLEQSVLKGTEWVIFEPNDEVLWTSIKLSLIEFLTNEWKKGALAGAKPNEAFFVKCDRSTMTPADIDDQKLYIQVGVALARPSEFLVFKIVHEMERVGPRILVDENYVSRPKY
jgi:phage tail sheath protein FI